MEKVDNYKMSTKQSDIKKEKMQIKWQYQAFTW